MTTAAFTQPAVGATVSVTVGSTAWINPGQTVYIAGGGYYNAVNVTSATTVSLQNLGFGINASAGTTVGALAGVSSLPVTATLTSFVQPAALGATVAGPVTVGSAAWMAVGETVFIGGAGTYTVTGIAGNNVTLQLDSAIAAFGAPVLLGAAVGTTVTVTENDTGTYLITFTGNPTGGNVPLMIANVTAGVGSAFLSATGGTVVAAGSVLQLTTPLQAEPLFLFGDGVANNGHNSGALENVTGANTYTGTITLMTNATIGVDGTSSLFITSPNAATTPAINDLGGGASGQFTLTKEGNGALTLAATDSYEGGTFVNQGILNLQNSGALGLAGTTTTVLDLAQLQLQQAASGPVDVTNQNLVLSGVGPSGTGALYNVFGNNIWGSPDNTVTLTSVTGFSPQSTPAGVVAINVLNSSDTLTINSSIGEAAAEQSFNDNSSTAPTGAPQLVSAVSSAGGSFGVAGQYWYVVTAVGPGGESLYSNQTGISVAVGQKVTLTWDAVPNATSYRVYRSLNAFVYTPSSLVTQTAALTLVDSAPPVPTLLTDCRLRGR